MEKLKEFSHFCSDQNMEEWLKEVFQEDIPSFDGTPEFVEVLKTIKAVNETAEKDAKAIIKAEKSMKNFYNEKAEELQMVTDFIQLNSETCQRVESLASMAEKMKLKEPSLTNFLLGMTEMEDKELLQVEKKHVTDYHVSVFCKKVSHTTRINEKLRRCLKSLAKIVEIQKMHYPEIMNELKYFGTKKFEVKKIIETNEEILEKTGYNEEKGIRHSVLVEKAQKLKDLEEHLKTLENKLQTYYSLDPNFQKTAKAVEKEEEELIKVDKELQSLLQIYENL